ncbi:MAG TPA: hypothetical protein VFY81_10920, partial [Gammaproteobacteria bacterium]|nr:hypothetical protein [Gammaproteobacteria bacterium]
MDKEEAAAILDSLIKAQKHLSDAFDKAKNVRNRDEAESLKRTIMEAIADISADAVVPIITL